MKIRINLKLMKKVGIFEWWEKGKKYYPAQELRNGK